MLPKQAIEEFKRLYKKCYGEELSDAEAQRRANNLIDFYRAVLKSANRYQLPKQEKSKK
jgi:hypothetical protein